MKNRTLTLFFSILLFVTLISCGNKIELPQADLVIKNGFIYTVDQNLTAAEAAAIKNGTIIFVGNNKDINKYIGDSTLIIDLEGRTVLPGFIDSHAHPISTVKQLFDVNLKDLNDIKRIQKAILDFQKKNGNGKFIRGRGWSNTLFAGIGPDKIYLDEIINNIPVVLSSEDGHSKWVNSKALELAGINKFTKDPDGGVIERYPGTREPNGTLRENASDMVSKIIPYYNLEELVTGLETYQKMALSYGITTAHDVYLDFDVDEIAAYKLLEKENRLKIRFRASMYTDPDLGISQVTRIYQEHEKHKGDLFQINSAKIFIDGVVEGRTAYLKEAYNQLPGFYGQPLWDFDSLNNICAELEKYSIQIHVHAIGDAAVSKTLDAFKFAQDKIGPNDNRNSITHLQLVSPEDILRFKELEVIAVPQPYWFMKDSYYTNIQVPYLGQNRADEEYPMESFFNAGVMVASSSDYPVTIPCNPFVAIQIGITRSEINNSDPANILWPEESATLEQMINSFTINGAYANFIDNVTGSIEIGKSADLIIIDADLFNMPVKDFYKSKVLLTLFRGEEVFRDSSYSPCIL